MKKIDVVILAAGLAAVAYGVGHYVGTRQMIAIYGDVLSGEALYYLAERDAMDE
jgi:hypothetical protein